MVLILGHYFIHFQGLPGPLRRILQIGSELPEDLKIMLAGRSYLDSDVAFGRSKCRARGVAGDFQNHACRI